MTLVRAPSRQRCVTHVMFNIKLVISTLDENQANVAWVTGHWRDVWGFQTSSSNSLFYCNFFLQDITCRTGQVCQMVLPPCECPDIPGIVCDCPLVRPEPTCVSEISEFKLVHFLQNACSVHV